MKRTTTAMLFCIIFLACNKNDLKKDINNNEKLSGPPPTACYYPSATVSTHAGAGYSGFIDGHVLLAQFKNPRSIASFGSSFYIGDKDRIRKITGTEVSTFLTLPDEDIQCIAIDLSGNIYVGTGESGYATMVKKFSPAGTLLASYGHEYYPGYRDGKSPLFLMITGLAVDETGLVYVAEMGNYAIRVINLDGTVSTLAGGLRSAGRPGWGFEDGPVSTAKLGFVRGVAVSPAGDKVYVADDHAVRMITGGYVYTIAGGSVRGIVDGDGASARFHELSGIALDGAGNLYVTDSRFVTAVDNSSYVRKVIHMTSGLVAWKVTTLAGGTYGYANGTGLAAKFYRPAGIVIDNGATTAYVADAENYRIRKMTLACGITF